MRVYIVVSLVLASLVALNAFWQVGLSHDGQPETVEQALERHHVPLDKEALFAALQNPDAEVRSLAAHKLAMDGNKDAIPLLVKALKAEPVSLNRVNLASSIAQLGDRTGATTLKSICSDTSETGYVRMDAARHVQELHDNSCQSSVLRELESHDDPEGLIYALHLSLNLDKPSAETSDKIFSLTVKALSNGDPGVRMTASNVLGRLGNTSAIPYLEEASAKEENRGCLLQMQTDLQRLRTKRSH
jgi:HEAT repeat protein